MTAQTSVLESVKQSTLAMFENQSPVSEVGTRNSKTWQERREMLDEFEVSDELRDTAGELYAISRLLSDADQIDDVTAGGIVGLLNIVANKLTDIASGRLPHEALN